MLALEGGLVRGVRREAGGVPLLMKALRMAFVIGCFAAVAAILMGVRIYAFVPGLHH